MNFAVTRSHVAEPDKTGGKSTIIVGARERRTGSGTATIALREDVSSIVFLQACSLPSQNSLLLFETWDEVHTADLLSYSHIIY